MNALVFDTETTGLPKKARQQNLEEFYNLRKNKGYGTEAHREGIKNHGITQWHRKSFGMCKNY